MQTMKRFTLAFAAMTGLGIAPLIGQTPTLQAVPLSAVIDVVSVRTLSDGNTLRQERKMNFYRRADGSTRVEEPNRVVIVDNSSHTVTVLDTVGKVAQVQNAPPALAKSITPPAALSLPQTGVNNPNTAELSSNTDLGVKMIAGYSARGIQRTIALFHRPSALPLVDQYTTFPYRSTTHTESPDAALQIAAAHGV